MNLEKLKNHIPNNVINEIPNIQLKFGINTPLRLAHFLAQCGHESGNFTTLRENLSYSDINRIIQIFKYDVDSNHNKVISESEMAKARTLVKNPQGLANFVYANQNGNGDEASGDGYNFRGRGYIQLTGKENYINFGKDIGVDLLTNPDMVATTYPLLSAAWFFYKKDLIKLADIGATDHVVELITKKVNGGLIGLQDRIKHFNEYYSLLK